VLETNSAAIHSELSEHFRRQDETVRPVKPLLFTKLLPVKSIPDIVTPEPYFGTKAKRADMRLFGTSKDFSQHSVGEVTALLTKAETQPEVDKQVLSQVASDTLKALTKISFPA
jgi:hypothetical protein